MLPKGLQLMPSESRNSEALPKRMTCETGTTIHGPAFGVRSTNMAFWEMLAQHVGIAELGIILVRRRRGRTRHGLRDLAEALAKRSAARIAPKLERAP